MAAERPNFAKGCRRRGRGVEVERVTGGGIKNDWGLGGVGW